MSNTYPNVAHTAMILAAGLGTRMRPLTNNTPKPLIQVAGKSIINYGLDRLREAHVQNIVVNAHYLPDQIIDWSKKISQPKITVSDETNIILDTGGGIAKALPLLGKDPFFVLNSDCFWTDKGEPALERLRANWDGEKMDCLLLLCAPKQTTGYDGTGDFKIHPDGKLSRQKHDALAYIGAYIVHPRLFNNAPIGKFSMNHLWNKAVERERLYGIAHLGHWLHVGTPDAIAQAEQQLKRS